MALAAIRTVLLSVMRAIICIALLASIAHAQGIQLTPTQQQMLDSLPPAQRQQAMDAFRQLQQQGRSTTTDESMGIQQLLPDLVPGLPVDEEVEPRFRRIEENSRLIVDLLLKLDIDDQSRTLAEEDSVLSNLSGSRFYRLDDQGILVLPGLADIPLLGLTEIEAARRIGAEPALRFFDVFVSILDAEPIDAEALEPFGYDLFESLEVSFEPARAGPVPPDYILGPGDNIRVQLFGNVNGIYEFEVTRDGVLNLPELGPISVAGLPFSEFRQDLKNRVQEMLIGTQVSVSMGELRIIRIFVLGEANRPGSYTVSSLATISSALYRSGGISRIGSLRNIQLKRQGRLVTTLDLYDLLLRGDTSRDRRLQPGDVLFITPIGETVGVGGAVKRPAIYELKRRTSIADAVALAGGLLPDAYPHEARLERINADRDRMVLSIDVDSAEGANVTVQTGDVLMIPYVLPELKEAVTLAGHVQRPGSSQWRPDMWLTDLIPTALHLQPGADANYILIRRQSGTDRTVSAISADLAAAYRAPHSAADVRLESSDTVHVFSMAYGRQRIIAPILKELELQARSGAAYQQVRVGGRVRAPGAYPLEEGMRVSDLIRAGGQLDEAAYLLEAELTRYDIGSGQHRETKVVIIDLGRALAGDHSADLLVAAHDVLNIKQIPLWQELEVIEIEGEVQFPGKYPIRRGEHLSSVLTRAGGLTDAAFAEGAIFLREDLRRREQEQLIGLAERLEGEVEAAASGQNGDAGSTGARRALLEQVKATEATGRLVIDLPRILAGEPDTGVDIILRDGDQLLIPRQSQTVTIVGEVQFPTSHIYEANVGRDDYIGRSGGITFNADKKRIYVVRANGSVVANGGSRFFRGRGRGDIQPGDTIVVPLEAAKISKLTLWTNVTTILYNIGIAAAAVATF